jgi:hypothetical protein
MSPMGTSRSAVSSFDRVLDDLLDMEKEHA